MVSKRILLLAGGLVVAIVGLAAWAYACCGAFGAGAAAPTETATVTPPFTVHDVTGPAKGQSLCYICRYGGRPSFVVFTRSTDGHVRHLAKTVDKFVTDHKDKGVRAFVVLLGESNETNRNKLAALAREHNLTIPLTIAADGAKGPKGYTLPEGFDTHVLVAHRNKVRDTITVNCSKEACGCTKCAKVADVLHAGKHLLDNS